MKGKKRAGAAVRRSREKNAVAARTARFLRRTFYYLQAEQFMKISSHLLCETS